MQTAILVLGMHRSGTSALARVVNLLGADLNRELMGPKGDDNERGFWESEDVMHLHDDLLKALGTGWDETIPLPENWWRRHEVAPIREGLLDILRRDFAESRLWAVKDPRMCRLLPLWLDMLSELRCRPTCVVIIRNPAEVVDSLFERSGLAPGFGYPLWLDHVLEVEAQTRSIPRAFVTYDQLLDDWRAAAERIAKQAGFEWPRSISSATAEVENFLARDLRHHCLPENTVERDEEISRWVVDAYRELKGLTVAGESPAALHRLDGVRADLRAAELLYGRSLASGRGERGLLHVRVQELEVSEATLTRALEAAQVELEKRDEQLQRAKEIFEDAIRVKEMELGQANQTLAETIRHKDTQIAGINEYFEMRSDELNRLRHEFQEQRQVVEQLRGDLRERTQERDAAVAELEAMQGENGPP